MRLRIDHIVETQRIRSIQLLLLMCGGVMILFGFMRMNLVRNINAGYHQLYDVGGEAGFTTAIKAFEADLKGNPRKPEALVGLVLANLSLHRVRESEQAWRLLSIAPPEPKGAVSLLADWQIRDPRGFRKYEGDLQYAQAWLSTERLVRGYRRGLSNRMVSDLRTENHKFMNEFEGYILRQNGGKAPDDSSPERVQDWVVRYNRLREMITNADTRKDVDAGIQDYMKIGPGQSGEPGQPTDNERLMDLADLRNMFNLRIERAVVELKDLPEGFNVEEYELTRAVSYALRLLAEIERRGESLHDRDTVDLLRVMIGEASSLREGLDSGTLSLELRHRAHLLLSMSLGLAQLSQSTRGAEAKAFGDQADVHMGLAQSVMREIRTSDVDYSMLRTLEDNALLRLREIGRR